MNTNSTRDTEKATENTSSNSLPFDQFIKNFEQRLVGLFEENNDIHELSCQRGLPKSILKGIMDGEPLSVAIQQEYGGRGAHVKECLGVLAAASYQSLPLSLMFGINIALFLEPLAKYGEDEVKKQVLSKFVANQHMGGLMITEPAYGSDALNMKTFYQQNENGYHINGEKHWQGLTGMADYWLIAARGKDAQGNFGRDIDFFLSDSSQPAQQIVVKEYYDNAGLYMIPYGLNELNITVPTQHRLKPETTGIKMMLDILHRSRLQFPGMAMGFIKRMLDEALCYCRNRMIGASNLLSMDSVQFQLGRIQLAYTICSAMCARSSQFSSIANNLATEGLEANTMKAVVTDLMQESAQLLVQLSGARGYRVSHIGGRGIMDSRPFQIFEGSNEMLYTQIAEIVVKTMKKQKEWQLYTVLKQLSVSENAVDHFKELLTLTVSEQLPQRKLVELGKIIARVICINYVIELHSKGFSTDLYNLTLALMKQELTSLTCGFQLSDTTAAIDDYQIESSWLNFA